METKLKKFISNIPAEDLKNFLNDYELDLPKDFSWKNGSKKYNTILFNSILNANDNHKSSLLEIIERIHEMVDELGQKALCAEIGNNETFFSLKSDHARCLWAIKNHPEKFQKAQHCASLDYKRKSREWSSFVGPKGRKINDSKEHIEEFKSQALQHFNISKRIKVDLFYRTKTDHHDKEIEIFQLVAYHDGLQKSVQTFEKEDLVTKFIAFVNEFSISYEPHSGIIEVTSESKDIRTQLAKSFANTFLKTQQDIDEIKIKKYDLSKLKQPYDFMQCVDLKDGIEEVKVTMLKLKPLNSRNSNTIESPFTQRSSIYNLADEWYGSRNPLHGSFVIKKAKLSIKFKSCDKKPRGKLLNVIITEPNGCDLKDRSEKQKLIGNKYLERWGLMGKNIKITPQIFKLLMEIAEQSHSNISHKVLLSEFGTEAAKFLKKDDYLTSGIALEHYWVGDDDKPVHYNEKLNSFFYLSDSGKYVKIDEEELKTYDINFEKIVNFIADELAVLESSKTKQNQHLEGILYFVGNAYFQKKKTAVFFARRVNDNLVFKKIEEFFLRESPSALPKIILTSSNPHCPESLKSKVKIISIPKLLGLANGKALFNIDYIANILSGRSEDEPKPDVYCSEDGSNLHIGKKSWKLNGDKQRQIIKIMCDFYAENPEDKIRWINILNEADIESQSRFRDMFRKSAVAEAINYENGFVWFKSEEDF